MELSLIKAEAFWSSELLLAMTDEVSDTGHGDSGAWNAAFCITGMIPGGDRAWRFSGLICWALFDCCEPGENPADRSGS